MRKIPTIFERDWNDKNRRVIDKTHPDCDWVFDGGGIPTQKLDGTSCMIRGEELFKRREIKSGQPLPPMFETAGEDAETGKIVGWVPIGDGAEDAYHREAMVRLADRKDGTYELIGPKVQGNTEHATAHILVAHEDPCLVLTGVPTGFSELADWMAGKDIEGVVWHHPDGRMAKIKLRDFGIKRTI